MDYDYEAECDRAHDLVEDHADADMSFEEILSILTENGVPEDVAIEVARDVRGEE